MRNREENAVHPERCGVRLNKFDAIQALVANALTLFRVLKNAESSLWQSLVPRELFLPATRSLSRCRQELVSRSGGLGHQIWWFAPHFAATFWTGFSFRKIFHERLFIGSGDYRRDVSYVDCLAVFKSSELRFDRFDLLSLLLVHNTGLQDLERL